MILEIACFNVESAVIAEHAGADRIELCTEYSAGGLYPGESTIQAAIKSVKIPLMIMVRPRGGNFVYDSTEINRMKEQITQCKNNAASGVVFGVLDDKGNVDKQACKLLVDIAQPMTTTFHRAFDEVNNPLAALEDIIECGFDRILTSGNATTAIEGAERILELQKIANDRINMMPGGGVRSENIAELKKKTISVEYHSAAMNVKTLFIDENEIIKMKAVIS